MSRANISGIVCIVMWSFSVAMVAYLTRHLPPMEVGVFSMLGMFLGMLPYWALRKESLVQKFKMPVSHYITGIACICGYNIFWLLSLKNAPPLEASSLNYLWPALLLVFASVIENRMPPWSSMLGVFSCFVGSVFIYSREGILDYSFEHALGLVLATGAAVIWAFYSTITRYVRFSSDRVAVFCFFTGVAMVPLHFIYEDTVMPTALEWGIIALYAATRVSFILWDYSMKNGQAVMIGSLAYFVPLFSTLGLVASGLASYSENVAIGVGLIIVGCLLVNAPRLKELFRN